MSSTNKTTNYQLSQFIGTDVPAWLVDYNGDMGKIDVQMKANDTKAQKGVDDASSADAKATQAISDASTANTNAQTAQAGVNANTASITEINSDLANLKSYFNLSVNHRYNQTSDYTITGVATALGAYTGYVNISRNSTGTLCKIYSEGGIRFNASGAGWIYCDLVADTGLRPSEEITISAGFLYTPNQIGLTPCNIIISTNGHVRLQAYANYAGTTYVYLPPCLYFMQNFGDVTPTP